MSDAGEHDPTQRPPRVDAFEVDPPTEIVPQPYLEPSMAVSSDAGSGWRTVSASVRGTSHEKTGAVCQDSHFHRTVSNDTLLAAISDGAGSAPKSELGSEIAARTAVEALRSWCALCAPWPDSDEEWAEIMRSALRAAREAVEREAETQGAAPRDLAATLIVLLATPDLVVAAQIGDGAAVIADTNDTLTALTTPQSGEYLNETTFLISPHAVEQAQTTVWRGRAGFLAAFSDGLQMLALRMSDGTPHAPFFTPLFRFIKEQQDSEEAERQLRTFLGSPRITQRADDDLTLLLAHWTS